ncbi:PAS domain-containing sensor histidine kinase [Jejuia spongiicola]|uniref:histidine kinase n=1 Tax=Jejuia spongiicola TaxID=2942207 RepID=A0ABT0QBT6_9FLAO|nr:PAS domain S-box protein [Jejuia spongiicola]MCL6293948.1 PAS domain S-box protein [Jejuia spongiicola]
MSQKQIDILERALAREKAARKQAEKILEDKSLQLFNTAQELKGANEKLELLLEEKKSQLQGVFENINDAYLIMDLNGNAVKMNDAATELFGYDISKERLNVINLIYKADANYAFKSFKKLRKHGSFTNYTARIITKTKAVKWVHINASVIYNKVKQPIAAQGIIRDITESKRTAALIEEQKKELDIIVENSSLGIVLSQKGNIIRTNDAIQELLGYTEKELSELTIKDVSAKEDFSESKDYLIKMDSGKIDNFVIDKRYKKKDGSVLWAKTNVNAVRDNLGNIKYQVALIEDITSEREKSLIIDMINDVAKSILGKMNIYEIAWEITHNIAEYLNTNDCIIYLVDQEKETLEQIAAYGEKVEGKNQILNKITLPIGKGIVGTVAKTGKAEIIKNTALDSRYIVDDEKRLSEITVPIISDGRVIGIIDSEHIEKNYFTKEHLHTLESIANLVAMQLKSAINLRERQKAESKNVDLLTKLEKSNEELQEYAHIVSHDLKSPLRSIDALVNWIKEDNKGKLDDTSNKNLELIETTLEKMEQLISDVLLYSSVGSDSTKKEEVDLNILIEDLKQILFVPEHIKIETLNPLPIVYGDKVKLQQLFQNLISNAVKFNDKEEGRIEIDVQDQKSFYQFSIKDNGIGIDKKYHNKIFKIFHALQESKESTGIGLSIVKKIIDLFKGEIWIESIPTKGTTFHFTLKK